LEYIDLIRFKSFPVTLMKWSEDNSVLTDAQFGFRPGYGTHDAIFALHSIISKSLRQGKRLYCCFIDYVKAFDSVSHSLNKTVSSAYISKYRLSILNSYD
jgi:hypothetical protein